MKKIILVHGWEGNPNKDWFQWLKHELEAKNFQVFIPTMPDTMNPKKDAWVSHLVKTIGIPDEETYFVGHSLGCITILRYLETLQKNQKIGGAVFVAGFSHNLEYEGYKDELLSFFEAPIRWEEIKKHCNKFIAIHSTDDPYVPVKHSKIFEEKLNAESIIQQDMGHYNGKEYPVILEALVRITS